MKKPYVKVKPKPVKKSYFKGYIAVVALTAVAFGLVFSLALKPKKEIPRPMEIDVSEVTPEEITQVSEPVEIEVPITSEVEKKPEKEVVEPEIIPEEKPEKEAEEAGFFGEGNVKFVMPVSGEIINEYSGSKPVKSKTMGDWRVHSGIDIKALAGKDVVSCADGKVISAENNKLTGNTVTIEHANGFVSTVYNLQDIGVQKDDIVRQGDILGTVGSSAALEALEDPHVHFEIKKDGKYVSPKEYMK